MVSYFQFSHLCSEQKKKSLQLVLSFWLFLNRVEGKIQCEISKFLSKLSKKCFSAHQISVHMVNNHFTLLCQKKLLLPNCLPRLIKRLCIIGNSLVYHNSQCYFLALIFHSHWCSLPLMFLSPVVSKLRAMSWLYNF